MMVACAVRLVFAPADVAWKSCALRNVLCDPRWVPNQRGSHAAGALYPCRRVTRVRGRGERDARRSRPVSRGRAGPVADAMRSTPLHCAAGKRARRFDAATSCCVIRVVQRHARRISAPDMCRPHASVVAAGAAAYEPRAISRRAERRRTPAPLVRCSVTDLTK
jgi:hypothetical protein